MKYPAVIESATISGAPFPLGGDTIILGRNTVKLGTGVRLENPDRTPSAVATGMRLAEEIQATLASIETGSFDDEMKSLRGRSWSL